MRRSITLCVGILLLVSGCGDSHESVINDSVKLMKEMTAILKTVKDEESAKAAKPKLKALSEKMEAIEKRSKALGEPTAEQQKKLEEKFKKENEKVVQEFFAEMMRVGVTPGLAQHLEDAMPKNN